MGKSNMKANDWININDKLPKIGERVMVCQCFSDGSEFARMATRVKINQNDRWYDDEGFELMCIAYWQEIVLPKKEE